MTDQPDRSQNLMDRPPGVQCTARSKTTGKRCGKAAMLGGNVCRAHGGAAPQTRAKAQRRLQQAADVLVQRLLGLALDGDVPDAVALAAIRDALDRAGMSAKHAVEVSVEPRPWEKIFAGIDRTPREDHKHAEPPALPASAEPATADADVIDAELVEPDAETAATPPEPPAAPRKPPPWHGDLPETADGPAAARRKRPGTGLMTIEEASAEQAAIPQGTRRIRSRRV